MIPPDAPSLGEVVAFAARRSPEGLNEGSRRALFGVSSSRDRIEV